MCSACEGRGAVVRVTFGFFEGRKLKMRGGEIGRKRKENTFLGVLIF